MMRFSMPDVELYYLLCIGILCLRGCLAKVCDLCDCSISDLDTEVPGVQNIKTLCNDGNIQWISPYGALRLELSYTTGGLFEACFKIQTENVKIKVSQESWKNSKSHFASALPQSSLLKPLFNVNGRTTEYCLYSNTPVLLYLEPERTHDMSGFPRMNLQYVLERKTPQHLKNDLEDCRPCDTKELIRSYCTSDFVFIGEMGQTRHRDDDDKTEVEFHVTRVVRKLGALHFRPNSDIQQQYGKIVVPKKCQVRNGRGIFLITGKVRFGELAKTCSPYLSDWENIANIALREGKMECPLVL